MASLPDHLNRRLLDACNLLTQVGDELQADLNKAVLHGITPERAGAVIRLACRVEALNLLAAEAWGIRATLISEAAMAQQLEEARDG